MPELPEVETIRRELHQMLPGVTIQRVDLHLAKMVKLSKWRFHRLVSGTKILAVRRRAKMLLIDLDNGWTIIIHLKMSGQLIWQSTKGKLTVGGHPISGGIDDLPNKFSHVVFHTNRGTLFFNDQRQFGFVKMVLTNDIDAWLERLRLGPEPLSREFTWSRFQELVDRHGRKKVKPALLDQTVIAGIGNIYADESCFSARVLPTRRLATLTPRERKNLYRGIQTILRLAIKRKGTTADAYRTANGEKGRMMPFLKVYQRPGRPCKRCTGTVQRMVLAGRGTHFCPRCQR